MAVQVNPTQLAQYLTEQLGIDAAAVQEAVDQYMAEHKVKSTTKTVDPDNQCMARIWAGGAGAQCSRARCSGGDFCKTHGTALPDGGQFQFKWEKHGRVDEEAPGMFQSGGHAKPKPKPKPKPTSSPKAIPTPVVVTPLEQEELAHDEDEGEIPFTPTEGMTLAEISYDEDDYMYDEATGSLYDLATFTSTGKLKKVGEVDEDSDSDEDE